MKAELKSNGVMFVQAESNTESFALSQWYGDGDNLAVEIELEPLEEKAGTVIHDSNWSNTRFPVLISLRDLTLTIDRKHND
jgi:hypothetical protein